MTVLVQPGLGSEVFAGIRTEWRHLFSAAKCSPFLSWEWMSAWFDSFGGGREPFIIKVYRGDRLIGILPMFFHKCGVPGLQFKTLSLMGEGPGGADHLDLISRPEDKMDALTAAFAFVQQNGYLWDRINLTNLAGNSNVIGVARWATRSKTARLPRFTASINSICPNIDLGNGWESVLRESKRASNFSRRLKQIEKTHGLEYRSLTSSMEAPEALERFFHLHDRRWENGGGSELTGHPRLKAFHRELVPRLASAGLVRFEELWAGGECRSSIYGLDSGHTFYYYNSGFDPDFSHLSVGLVLLGLSIKNACDRGVAVYDFLRGEEAYKFDWASGSANTATVTLSRHSLRVLAFERASQIQAVVEKISKLALPAGVADSVSSWRRAWRRNHLMAAAKANE